MHDTPTDTNLKKKLTHTWKNATYTNSLQNFKYFTQFTKQLNVINYTKPEGWYLEFIISFPSV